MCLSLYQVVYSNYDFRGLSSRSQTYRPNIYIENAKILHIPCHFDHKWELWIMANPSLLGTAFNYP